MAQQDYGAAEPILGPARKIYKMVNKYLGDPSKPASSNKNSSNSSTDTGKLPPEWEKANEESIKQQLSGKSPTQKTKVSGGVRKKTEVQRNVAPKQSTKRLIAKR